MTTAPIALATTASAHGLDEDEAPLAQALRARGYAVETPDWDDAAVEWSRYALVLPRSTWNYTDDLAAFLAWTERVATVSRLRNPPALIRWNTDKRYLLELERGGLAIVPTRACAPGEAWQPVDAPEWVVKPAVGAGSRGARRFAAGEESAAHAHAARLHAAGQVVLTQPYLQSVDALGETALVYFAGRYSHAIRKGPLLARGGGDVQGLFATETIEPRTPGADELALAERVVRACPGGAPLYARVDLIRGLAGEPRVLELELAEPSLFFAHAPGAAERFTDCVSDLLTRVREAAE